MVQVPILLHLGRSKAWCYCRYAGQGLILNHGIAAMRRFKSECVFDAI
jgi:hypothetical protein